MSEPIKISLESNAAGVLAALKRFPPAMQAAIAKALNLENELTVGAIDREKLSKRGPDTLGVVTNRLRSSIRRTDAVVTDSTVTAAIGSNVKYAGIHEFGFHGIVQVRQHQRRIIAYDRYEKHGSRFVQIAVGIKGTIRAHPMQMNTPERSYIRSTISERQGNYRTAVSAAILSAWGSAPASSS